MKRGQAEAFGIIIAIVLVVIAVGAVVQPVLNSLILSGNVTPGYSGTGNLAGYSTAQTIALQLPTFNYLIILAVIASAVLGFWTMNRQ